jgi:hypothetical protein
MITAVETENYLHKRNNAHCRMLPHITLQHDDDDDDDAVDLAERDFRAPLAFVIGDLDP